MSSISQELAGALALCQKKQWAEAEILYRKVLKKEDNNILALINLGAMYRQMGVFEKSRQCYLQALQCEPYSLDANSNCGDLCFYLKEFRSAINYYLVIVDGEKPHAESLYKLAKCYQELEDWQQCRGYLEKFLVLHPNDANGLLDMGNCLQHLGVRELALKAYEEMANAYPTAWKAQYSLTRWHDTYGKKEEFEYFYSLAKKYCNPPSLVDYSLAQSRFDLGRYEEAATAYQMALEAGPDFYSSQIGLAACYMQMKEKEKAKLLFESIAKSNDVTVLSELARTVAEYKFRDEAIRVLEKIVKLRPDVPDAHYNLARAYYENWDMSLSREHLNMALEIRSDYLEAEDLLVDLNLCEGENEDCLSIFRRRIERDGPLSKSVSGYLNVELYNSSSSALTKAQHHFELSDRFLRTDEKLALKHIEGNKVRVGFVSTGFQDKDSVGIFVQSIFANYTKKDFCLTAYYANDIYDDNTYYLKAFLDEWVDVAGWSDIRLRRKIIDDEIDILIDLSGHTKGNRLRMFALRAAPIQITWMGYPHSTGLKEMDYMIADSIICPPENDYLCSEQIIRLPEHCTFCMPPKDIFGEVNCELGKGREYIVFGSFNNLAKVSDATLILWLAVLKAVPNSRLKLKIPSFSDKQCQRKYIDYFVDAGIARKRLLFSGLSSLNVMMKHYNQVDIALDTIPYNGAKTTFQALWMGVPLLTISGDNFCGRMGASIMNHLGLPEWVAGNSEEFIDKACEFSMDRGKLLRLKQSLRKRMSKSALCDSKGFTISFEEKMREVIENYKIR